MGNVFNLPASTSFSPDQALESARQLSLESVLILGYDEDGELVIRSSKLERKDALWIIESAKPHIMGEE